MGTWKTGVVLGDNEPVAMGAFGDLLAETLSRSSSSVTSMRSSGSPCRSRRGRRPGVLGIGPPPGARTWARQHPAAARSTSAAEPSRGGTAAFGSCRPLCLPYEDARSTHAVHLGGRVRRRVTARTLGVASSASRTNGGRPTGRCTPRMSRATPSTPPRRSRGARPRRGAVPGTRPSRRARPTRG